MNLRKILFPVFAGLFLLSFAADARYIFVLPPAGAANPVLQGFSEQFVSMGPAIPIPVNTTQVLTNINASKAILVSENTSAAVSFINIQNGQLAGPVRSVNLEDRAARAAVLTPDGNRLLVLAGSNPGVLYVIDVNTETVIPGGRISVPLEPRDVVVTTDSRLAFILSIPSTLTVIDLTTGTQVSQQPVAGVSGNLAISLSPAGSVYVTSQYRLIEYNSQAPYAERARTALVTQPGKLHFSPDGRYALAKNILGNGSSLVTLDLQTRNADYPAGIQLSSAPITTQSTGINIPLQIDELAVISDKLAVAYVAAVGRMFIIQYPVLSISEIALAGIGSPVNISGIAISDEISTTRNLFYNSNGSVSRHDLLSNNSIGTNVATPGPIRFASAPSSGLVTEILPYGAGQSVAPGTQLRPYYVRVADSQGRPVFNAQVSFFADTPGVTLSTPIGMTNMNGYAQVTVTAPPINGDFTVRAVAGSTAAVLKSTVVGGTGGGGGGGGSTTGPRIIRVSGDGQLRRWFDGFADPLVVKIVDGAGNPIAGRQVIWTADGGANFSSPTITTTDANGQTQAQIIPAGSFTPGVPFLQYSITANADVGFTVFTMTSFPTTGSIFNPPPQVELRKPTQENRHLTVKLGAKTEDAIRVLVYSGGGNSSNPTAIPGVALNISTAFTDPKLGIVARCDGGPPLTGADGIASCNLIVEGPLGTTPLNVNIGSLTNFTDVRLSVTPGDPIAPVIVQGNNQTGKPGVSLPIPLQVRITDAFGNVLPGVPLSWSISPIGGVTLTNISPQSDNNGNGTARVILGPNAGKVQVKVTAGGKEATFDLTIESQVAGIQKVSGDNQPITVVNQVFPSPLVVQVLDGQNRPVAGANIQWQVTGGSATLGNVTGTTGADGRSQANVIAGTVASVITVTATLQGFAPISFQLQSRLPGPTLTPASFVNWATNEPGLAPGNLVLITGTGIAPNLRGTVNANLLTGNLPYTLAGVTLELRSQGRSAYAPIYRVSNENNVESLLVQIPFEINGTTADAVMDVSGGSSTVTGIPVRPASPGILEEMIAGRRAAVAVRSDGWYVTPTTPARRGEVIRIYTIGLGQTTPALDTNRVGSVNQKVNAVVAVGIDGQGVELIGVHTAENLVGVYEVLFRVPMTATIGNDRPLGFLVDVAPGLTMYSNPSILSIAAQ